MTVPRRPRHPKATCLPPMGKLKGMQMLKTCRLDRRGWTPGLVVALTLVLSGCRAAGAGGGSGGEAGEGGRGGGGRGGDGADRRLGVRPGV